MKTDSHKHLVAPLNLISLLLLLLLLLLVVLCFDKSIILSNSEIHTFVLVVESTIVVVLCLKINWNKYVLITRKNREWKKLTYYNYDAVKYNIFKWLAKRLFYRNYCTCCVHKYLKFWNKYKHNFYRCVTKH